MTINEVIGSLPQMVLDEYQDYDLRSWAKEAIGFLPDTTLVEKVKYLHLVNGTVTVPDDFKKVMGVFWQLNDPNPTECQIFDCSTPEEVQAVTCKLDVYVKIFLDSSYFQESFVPLKYVGDKSLLCRMCPNVNSCTEQFTIKDKTLYSSVTEGYLCFHYLGLECDEYGDMIIPTSEVLAEYIRKFILKRVYENKMLLKEEGASNIYIMYRQELDILFRRARGEQMMLNTNADNLSVSQQSYFNLLKSYANVSIR